MFKIFSDKILAISFFCFFFADFFLCSLSYVRSSVKNLFLKLKVEPRRVFLIHSDLGLKFSPSLPFSNTIFLKVLSQLCFNIHYLLDETYHNGGRNNGWVIQKEVYCTAGLFLRFFLCNKNQISFEQELFPPVILN